MNLLLIVTLSSYCATVGASWAKNLNYRSPSENHPSLGISVHKVVKRSVPSTAFSPSQLNFTHGVASGGSFSTATQKC
jgi:alkaline phosphatase D